ncbi:MAG: NUDIX domain-containing protein [Victivallales bacterium]|nr:NUDIX domain-containing protein [Victivallales bacterium]MCF7888637.1 NUDIX domain-containing protein [Victivallales bacterium]
MQDSLKWKIENTKYIVEDRWLKVRADKCISPNGHVISPYYVIEYPNWINVFALTHDKNVLLVEQYRHGLGRTLLELPSGTVEDDESPIDTARRELLEETGYTGDNFKQIGCVCPNTANHSNFTYSILALDIKKTANPVADETELVKPVLMPLQKVIEIAKNGSFLQALHTSTIFFALNELNFI